MFEAVVQIVFDKALKDEGFQDVYAKLCLELGQKAQDYWGRKFLKVSYLTEELSPNGAGWYFTTAAGELPADSPLEAYTGWMGPWEADAGDDSGATGQDLALKQGLMKVNFKRAIMDMCEKEFKDKGEYEMLAREEEEDVAKLGRGEMSAEELEGARANRTMLRERAKKRVIANISFIGQLYIVPPLIYRDSSTGAVTSTGVGLAKTSIIRYCCSRLLHSGKVEEVEAEDVECLCKLLSLCGAKLEKEEQAGTGVKAKLLIPVYMGLLSEIAASKRLGSRITYLALNMVNMQKDGWKLRGAASIESLSTPLPSAHMSSAVSSAQAAFTACMVPLRRLQLQQQLSAAICPDTSGAVLALLAAVEITSCQRQLQLSCDQAAAAWQSATSKVSAASLDAALSQDNFSGLVSARNTSNSALTRALEAFRRGLQRAYEHTMRKAPGEPLEGILRADASAATLAAYKQLRGLIAEYEALGPEPPAEGGSSITSISAALDSLSPTASDATALATLANCGSSTLDGILHAATSACTTPRLAATRYLLGLARTALQPVQPLTAEAAEQHRSLFEQEAADLASQLAVLHQKAEQATRAEALAASWPGLVAAEKVARVALVATRREIEDLQIDGQAPSEELRLRLSERQLRATACLAASEAAREAARTLAGQDCPEAVRLLRAMHPPPPTSYNTELERMWAELQEAGVALPFTRTDFEDMAPLARSHSHVYTARLRGTEERVVLKEFSAMGVDLRLFCNELRMLRRLAHPNIIALSGVLRDGAHLYLKLPFVDGGSLREWLEVGPTALPRTPAQCVRAFCGTMSALAYVHSCGVVHRDLKPDNILMHLSGVPRLADFGISTSISGSTTLATSAGGSAAGTEAYKSPEQLRGERASPASDLYAAGLVLHELVFRTPYALSVQERRTSTAAALLPPASAAAEGWPLGLVEAALSLLTRLLAPVAADRPVANAVLSDLFCERSGELLQGGGSSSATAAPPAAALTQAKQALSQLLRSAPRLPEDGAIDLPRGEELLRAAVAAFAEHFFTGSSNSSSSSSTGGAPSPPRLVLTLGGDADPERALDAILAAAMRPQLRLFGTAVPFDDDAAGDAAGGGSVLPLPPRAGAEEPHRAALFVVGAGLAQAALQGWTELNALARLPLLAFEAIAKGPEAALVRLASLPAALEHLAAFDASKARAFRGVLMGAAEDFDLEVHGWQGVDVAVTDTNKGEVLQRECEKVLVRSRHSAWEALHAGFLAGGGRAVAAVMEDSGIPSLRELVYDAGKSERRRAAQGLTDHADEAFLAAHTRPCPVPTCRARCTKDDACMHVTCGACGTAWNWCCARIQHGHPARSCPNGGDTGVRLVL